MLANVFEIGATQVREHHDPARRVTAVEINDPIPEHSRRHRTDQLLAHPGLPGQLRQSSESSTSRTCSHYLQRPGEINLQVLLRPVHFVPDTRTARRSSCGSSSRCTCTWPSWSMSSAASRASSPSKISSRRSSAKSRDEHDTEVETVRELGPNLYSIAGNLPVKDFNRLFDEQDPRIEGLHDRRRIPRDADRTAAAGRRDGALQEPDLFD